jgi:hypothetical protein
MSTERGGAPMKSILDLYSNNEPTPQSTIDIFKDEWSSKLPDGLSAGSADLFNVDRVMWPQTRFDFSGKSVLELGPLEGGQTYALHNLGASIITAVEGNSRAFLKCLIVKELLALHRAHFLYGDIIKYLETTNSSFDIIFASGVLYHMTEPLKLLRLIKHHTNRCYLWTHYYDRDLLAQAFGNEFRVKFGEPITLEYAGYRCEAYPQYYGDALDWQGYCGGNAPSSMWLCRSDIINFLRHIGFNKLEIGEENPAGAHGPTFSIAAQFC